MADCIFCKIAAGQIPAQLVHQDARLVAFRDVNPQAPTHILVIPRDHLPSLNEAGPEHAALLAEMLFLARDLAKREGLADRGYRTLLNTNREAGQTVFHIHLHLLGGLAVGGPPG
mgnify:CR=1 FL=1